MDSAQASLRLKEALLLGSKGGDLMKACYAPRDATWPRSSWRGIAMFRRAQLSRSDGMTVGAKLNSYPGLLCRYLSSDESGLH